MAPAGRLGLWVLLALSVAAAASAEPPPPPESEYEIDWSATVELRGKVIETPCDDDDVTCFFDQYEYTDNKDSTFPVEFGLSDFRFDLFRAEETPVLQLRLRSPTSKLSFADPDSPFLNQRIELLGRPEGVSFDFDYWRFRTDDLRLFPSPSGVGSDYGSVFNDDTAANDRFFVRRTGFAGEVRSRLRELIEAPTRALEWWAPELALRGGFESREGNRQFRFLFGGGDVGAGANDTVRWRSLTQRLNQEVSDVGGGLLVAPGGLFTLTFDVDHERFREKAPTLVQNQVYTDPPIANSPGTIGFIPDANRTTGSVRFQSRIGERAVIHGGFQASSLKQVDDRTPLQGAAGLTDNEVRFYSANLAGDVVITPTLSANAYFKFDYRDNRIQRDTALFNPSNGSQIDEFLDDLERTRGGAELVYRPRSAKLFALGYRGEYIDRTLDFAQNGGAPQILPTNAQMDEDTQTHSVYLRSQIRVGAGSRVLGEVGYRIAPETGYVRELDNATYFSVRASYSLPVARPVTFSAFARGEFGENRDFQQISETSGMNPNRNFDRDHYSYGVTLSGQPCDDVTLFGSFFQDRDSQDFDLVRSNLRRFQEPTPAPVNFYTDNPLDYRADLISAIVGGHTRFTDHTDGALSFSYTRSKSRFERDNATSTTLYPASLIKSNIYIVDFTIGHWLVEGLRLSTGYRFQAYRDHTPLPSGLGSVVAPFDLSTNEHTMTLGITLTSDFFNNRQE